MITHTSNANAVGCHSCLEPDFIHVGGISESASVNCPHQPAHHPGVSMPILTTPTAVPFEFIVTGRPISQQTKQKQRLQNWKTAVRKAAELAWPLPEPLSHPLQIIMTHYYDAQQGDESGVPDSDNIIKPVREALSGLIYLKEAQITDFQSRRRNLNGSFRLKGLSRVLAEGFCRGKEFLYLRVEEAPDPSDLS